MIIQPPANTTVRLGERVNLTCISEGVPAPTYTWFRDSVELVDETLPYLLITSAAPNDRGYYICTVSNSEGTVGSDLILLSMRGKCLLQTGKVMASKSNDGHFFFRCATVCC